MLVWLLLFSFSFSLAVINKSNKIIIFKNNIPDCKDCIFYSKNDLNIDSVGLCKKYGEKETITEKIIFYESKKCRDDIFRCGEYGKHFIKKHT